ncbi:hypothetical protein EP7_004424 [Isosphaeraceae bacterium EP7]
MKSNAFELLIVPACEAMVTGLAGGYVIKSMVDAFDAFCVFVSQPSEDQADQDPFREDLEH